MPDFGSDVSTIYNKEPFERERADDEHYEDNRRILVQLRYHLDQAESWSRMARDHLELEENDNNPDLLQEAFEALAASEKENEE